MTLEQYFDNKRVNIKNLALRSSEVGSSSIFDPETDITPDDWNHILKEVEEQRKEKDWIDFLPLAADLKTLSPKKYEQLFPTGKSWQNFEDNIASYFRESGFHSSEKQSCRLLGYLKTISPRAERDLHFYIHHIDWHGMTYELIDHFNYHDWQRFWNKTSFNSGILTLKLIFKDDNFYSKAYEKFEKNYILKGFEKAQVSGLIDHFNGEWGGESDLEALANMKLFSPERFEKKKGGKNLNWGKMKKMLSEYRKEGWWTTFLKNAARMNVLAAEKIEMTEDGLEVWRAPQRKFSGKSSLPEKRKF